ncbi:hypothetical protein M513_13682 [Trichuris suis]|uniref:SH2 domain-containing protein n=1 Tax=Trichuris suis TaxID=68888 RepID=A0A085LKE6_9BILA|nr:hypothetical protein M513_13682 [Trichuris suis]
MRYYSNFSAIQEVPAASAKSLNYATCCVADNRCSPASATEVTSNTSAPAKPTTTECCETVTYDVPWDRVNSSLEVAPDEVVSRFDVVPVVNEVDRPIVNEECSASATRRQEMDIYDEPWEKAVTYGEAPVYGKGPIESNGGLTSRRRTVTQAISFQPNNIFNHGRRQTLRKKFDSENLVTSQSNVDNRSPSVINAALRRRHGLGIQRAMLTYADSYISPSAPPANENAFHLVVVDDSPRQDISFESGTSDRDFSSESPENYGSIFCLSMDSPTKDGAVSDLSADSVIACNIADNSAMISISKQKNLHPIPEGHVNGGTYSFEKQKWYHGRITRQQAEERMAFQKNGAFLVRRTGSENSDEYALTVRVGADIMHMKIQKDPFNRWIIGAYSLPFLSISDMVKFYSVQKLPIQGVRHVRLSSPVMP